MSTSKNFKRALLALSVALPLASAGAGAAVIDFEGQGTPHQYNDLDKPIDGFVFNYTMDNFDLADSPWSGDNGGAHSGQFAAVNNYQGNGELSLANGYQFDFSEMYVKTWDQLSGQHFTVSGWLNGVQVGASSIVAGPSWTRIGGNFGKIDKLVFGGFDSFVVDDIVVTASAVPEPQTYALLLAGLGLLGAAARRRSGVAR